MHIIWGMILSIFLGSFSLANFALANFAWANDDEVLKKTYVQSPEEAQTGSLDFDPTAVNGLYSWQTILEDLFLAPLLLNDKGQFEPGAAKSWSYSDDGMTLTLELQPDYKWSDGVPVTAEDFVFALERMRDPKFAFARLEYVVDVIAGFDFGSAEPFGVTAPSSHQVQIVMKRPYAIDNSMLSEMAFIPLPRHKAPENPHALWSEWSDGVTNGAYVLDAVREDKIKLRRNPNAPAQVTPYFEWVETTMRTWPEAVEAFLNGEVDYLYNIPERQMNWFVEENIKTIAVSGQVYYYALNQKRPELQDRRVRRALRLAVDRQALVNQLISGTAQAAYSIIPEGVQSYKPDPSLVVDDMNAAISEAKQLMEEAGYGPDKRLSVSISSNHSLAHVNLGEFVRAGWNQIYVDAELDMSEKDFGKWFKRFTNGDFMIGRRSWNSGIGRMDAFMDVCKPLKDPRCGHYDDAEYQHVMNSAYMEKDPQKQIGYFREADRMITDADVIIPLYHGLVPVALSQRIDTSDFDGRIRRVRSFEVRLRSGTK